MRLPAFLLLALLMAAALPPVRATHWPYATYTSPPDGGVNVPVSTNLEILWSEAMNTASVEASFVLVDVDHSIEYDSSDGTWVHGLGTPSSTFDPSFTLPTGTALYFQVCSPAGAISLCPGATSVTGEPLDQNRNDLTDTPPLDNLRVDFTTAGAGPSDTTPPQVTFSVPRPGQSGFPANGDLVLTFSERMDHDSVEVALSLTGANATLAPVLGTVTWSQDGSGRDVLTWDPLADLVPLQSYALSVAGTARDLSGNLLDGDSNGFPGGTFTATFSTAGPAPPPGQPIASPWPWLIIVLLAIMVGVLLLVLLLLRRRRPTSPPGFYLPPPQS